MPSWKKVIISGSDASLNSLNITSALTASGLIYPNSDGVSGSVLTTDGSGNLSFTTISADGGSVDTGSLLVTASAAGSTITFEKGDGSTFNVVVSSEVTPANAVVTASIDGSTLTFEKGDTSTFDIILPAGGYSGSNATAHLDQTIAAATWSFAHNLDDRYPVFTVFDSNGDIIVPNRVETVDNNNANIYFTSARTGTATAVIASSISQIASVTADFTNQSTVAVTHSLDTRNIHVSVYDTSYNLVVPQSITLDTLDTVVVTFPSAQSGTVVVAQGGHIISGSTIAATSASYIPSTGVDGPLGMDSITSASYALTASYADTFNVNNITVNQITASVISASYIDLDIIPDESAPAYKEGRMYYNAEDGALTVYNDEGDISLQVGQEFWVRAFNPTGNPILNGTPVRASGSQGDRIDIYPALAEDHTTGVHFDSHIIGVATHDIEASSEGYVTAQGIVRGVDTTGFVAGDTLYLQTGSAGLRNTPPPFPYDIVQVGYASKIAENGFIFIEPKEPVHFNNISGLSGSVEGPGDLWIYQANNAWAPGKVLSGSYTINNGGLTADSFTGSLQGTASYASNADLLDGLNSSQFLRNDQTGTLTGDLTVTGTLTAQEFHTEFVSASIIYQSGSTQFGNSADDTHVFTGSILVDGDITGSINPTGHLLPSTTNLYDLGSPTQQWRDLYLSSASLYVDGVKIISSDANVLTFTTDNGQSIKILEQGSDDITLQTENGNIELKGTVEITSGKKIIDSAGTIIQFGDSLGVTGSIEVSGTVDGIDLQAFSSSIEQRITDLESFSSSLDATFATDADLNLVSSSVDSLNAATSSYALEANISGAFTSVSESIASDIVEIIDGTQTITSASYALTASYALNVPVTASYALTASYIDPTFISASAAAAGFGTGGSGGSGDGFPFAGDAVITGSLFVSGGLISGSFAGDGSQLTGIDVSSVSTVSQTFTSQTSVVVSHNFNSKDINVAVYNGSDQYIIPDTITLTDANTATVTFAVPTSGRVVVVKGGHIVTALGLTSKAGSVATSSFSATGSSFYYDVTFESSFESTNYSVALQAHSQFAVPESFPGHAWVDSNKTAGGFRIVVPSFDDTTDEIHWSAIAHGESDVTASNASTASYILGSNVDGAVALATTASHAVTASYALNAGAGSGFPFSGSAEITGSFLVSGSVVDFTQATAISGSLFSGSFFGDGTGLSGLGYGDTKKLTQTVAATTWSFSHNMNEQYPAVTVYNTNNEIVQPSKVEGVDAQTLKLYFGIPTAGTAVAVVGGTATTQEAGFNRVFTQGVAATTWSFEHNLGNKYPQVAIYDSNDELVIPGKLEAIDQNNLTIYFDTPQAGTATATVGGTSLTASYAETLVVTDTLLSSQQNTDVDTGTETVATVSVANHDGAFFDYVIKDGTNYRAGTVMAVWDGTSVQYADNSTADIGDTSGVTLSVDISGTDARLRAAVTSDNWNIKAFVRAL